MRMSLTRSLAPVAVSALTVLGVPQPSSAATLHPASPVAAHRIWVVHPGESIQAAVDEAASGDTIKIRAGTYHEAVCVNGKGLKVTGASTGKTVIEYPPWNTVADLPAVAANPCWSAHQKADAENDQTTLADDVSGLFFLNPDSRVEVSRLTTKNHPADGITVWGADGVDIHDTQGLAHERYGITVAASVHISISKNIEKGLTRPSPVFAGTGGITVSDTGRAEALVRRNRVENYNLGVFLKEARGGDVVSNRLSGNCLGILVFDDSAREIPDTKGSYEGGDWTVRKNVLTANNRYCIAGRDGSQRTSGVGIGVVNADRVVIEDNKIRDNVATVPAGEEPLNFPSGGVVLVGFAAPPGTSPPGAIPGGTVQNVLVTHNVVRRNEPTDIVVVQPDPQNPLILAPGPDIVIKDNRTS
ncbi:right-handed parallel beta-helix repeat-containing protein [Kineosporia mesophila]|uniref:Right-handed parallel beta-helix repeat-containing protein n=1 Tax=Kineosporia mesophila TaxID=566012 RepID=A0ABP7ACC5_9ACTN|nr:right-handed parallel beta-helix repeat-containing protein [Kineosporia mesophila]MCD5351239.1 right-handed parallel beta-helix repeat-containing protein [Kineosporia mesophila]